MIDYDTLKNWTFADAETLYDARDSRTYAMGIGIGDRPTDPADLRFVCEQDQHAFPTMALTIGNPGNWFADPGTGIDHRYIVHADQSLVVHAALPVSGTLISRHRVLDIVDKGEGRGAIVTSERQLFDKARGTLLATMISSSFALADGGFGGPAVKSAARHAMPDRAPDFVVVYRTLPQAALLFALSGDGSALHVDPVFAAAMGFERPILQGLCTFGIVARGLIAACGDGDADALRQMKLRFTAPVLPGETIQTSFWRDGTSIAFQSRVRERDIVVLDNGFAEIGAPMA